MEYFVDTNIFLRFLVKDHEDMYRECYQIIKMIKNEDLQVKISTLILSEIVWVMVKTYGFKKQEVIERVESILNMKNCSFTEDFNRGIALQMYKRNNIKFIDAMIASHSKILDKEMRIISYDQDFDQLDVERVEPSELTKE